MFLIVEQFLYEIPNVLDSEFRLIIAQRIFFPKTQSIQPVERYQAAIRSSPLWLMGNFQYDRMQNSQKRQLLNDLPLINFCSPKKLNKKK